MSKPKAYAPEHGYLYQILCRQGREWEHCDYAMSTNELKELLVEYKIAYGPRFEFCSIRLPMKYWPQKEGD